MLIDPDKVIVPNWFEKEEVEDMTGEKMSEKAFKNFHEWVRRSHIDDEISNMIQTAFYEWKEMFKKRGV